jgi:branched-chain amino acid transport system substrate-binding protein
MKLTAKVFSLLFILGCTLAVSCTQEQDYLDIAVIFPETGFTSYLFPLKNGLDLATEEVNSTGGINGTMIKLHYFDSQSNPDRALELFDQIEADIQPDLYFSVLSSVSTALAPKIQKAQVVTIALVASDPRVSEINEYMFSYYMAAKDELNALKPIMIEENISRLGVLYQDEEYGQSVYNSFKNWAEEQGIEVINGAFDVSGANLESAALNLVDTEAIMIAGFEANCIESLKTLRSNEYGGLIMGTSTLSTQTFAELNESENIYVATPAVYNSNFFRSIQFAEAYEAQFNSPLHHNAAVGYDIINYLNGVLSREQEINRNTILEQLNLRFTYPGIFGNIEKMEGQRNLDIPLLAAQFKNGELLFLN